MSGRKQHLVVDSLGLLLVVLVTAANLDDGTHAPKVLAKLTVAHLSRLDELRGTASTTTGRWTATCGTRRRGTSSRSWSGRRGVTGLVLLPYRWVVERTNAWTGKYRRNSKDHERTTASAEAMIQVGMIHPSLSTLRCHPQ